jgi:hypothetical protein
MCGDPERRSSVFSRARAIREGVLVDASERAADRGFDMPVAISATVWDAWVEPDGKASQRGETEESRLGSVLDLLVWAVKTSGGWQTSLSFVVLLARNGRLERPRLKAVCGPGDDEERVITIMFPHETIGAR